MSADRAERVATLLCAADDQHLRDWPLVGERRFCGRCLTKAEELAGAGFIAPPIENHTGTAASPTLEHDERRESIRQAIHFAEAAQTSDDGTWDWIIDAILPHVDDIEVQWGQRRPDGRVVPWPSEPVRDQQYVTVSRSLIRTPWREA